MDAGCRFELSLARAQLLHYGLDFAPETTYPALFRAAALTPPRSALFRVSRGRANGGAAASSGGAGAVVVSSNGDGTGGSGDDEPPAKRPRIDNSAGAIAFNEDDIRAKSKLALAAMDGTEDKLSDHFCDWQGNFHELNDHLLQQCKFHEIACPNGCGARMKRPEIDQHMATVCLSRFEKCSVCWDGNILAYPYRISLKPVSDQLLTGCTVLTVHAML